MALIRKPARWTLVGILLAAALCIAPTLIQAQAVDSAIGPGGGLWVGGQYSSFVASFPYQSNDRLTGIGAFIDYHFQGRLGIEAESHFLPFNGFHGESEANYLGGLQYRVGRIDKFYPFAQFLTGIGHINFPFEVGSGNYLVLAPGAGAMYRLSYHWAIRSEFEYQYWDGSPNYSNEPSHTFSPFGFRVGVGYRFSH